MGALIGTYIAFIIMEIIVAIPTYYLLCFILKRKHIEILALIACIVALGTGQVTGARFMKDVMISEFLKVSDQKEISEHGVMLTQDKWYELRSEFINDSKTVQNIHIGAAKVALPSTVVVAALLFWLVGRQKKSSENIEHKNT